MRQNSSPSWEKWDKAEEQVLWEQARAQCTDARERLIGNYLPFAKMLAAKLYAQRTTDEIDFSDFLQLASIGLIEAVDRYDHTSNAAFTTYASYRINGAILNGLEHYTERQKQLQIQKRIRERIHSIDTKASSQSDQVMASFERIASVAIGLALGMMLEEDGMYVTEEVAAPTAYTSLELFQLKKHLHVLLTKLPHREAQVIRYHYMQQLCFEEIGKIMGVTRGRASQLHQSALAKLRAEMATSRPLNLIC
ncbi:RNA polymerase sigma factor for flagellar operon FliA [Chitinivorax tropicus]|uniref:RNA polymerase sigma factor for flagellar operon FliA n=1 Tax=Chitinivorax tropicus TaxID=714531 RepID=A0A840MSA1_9PROT|nr:sigma-70 family RNA polymerase sigma factor [Chitinivorax tropicus]MBB5020295.1 RNA polymerase sigma factor for flagellar operon FliA [Chitinivorax tropicus]